MKKISFQNLSTCCNDHIYSLGINPPKQSTVCGVCLRTIEYSLEELQYCRAGESGETVNFTSEGWSIVNPIYSEAKE